MQETQTQVPSMVGKIPLEEGMATHSCMLAWRIHGQIGQATVHRAAKSGTRLKQFSMHKNYKNLGLSPGLKRSPGGQHGNPPQYSCLENPRDRGALRAIGHRIAQSDTTEATEHTRLQELDNRRLCSWSEAQNVLSSLSGHN